MRSMAGVIGVMRLQSASAGDLLDAGVEHPGEKPFSKPWWKLRTGHNSSLIQLFSTRSWNVASISSEKSSFAIAS